MTRAAPPGIAGACERLEWDSAFFGCRIARYAGAAFDGAQALAVREYCAAHAIDCLYVAVDAADARAVGWAKDLGARLAGVRIELEARVPGPWTGDASPVAFRPAGEGDIPRLRAIAGGSHHGTRFYADPGFDRTRADALYETWIETSCRGGADTVFVAEESGDPIGYVTCHLDPVAGAGRIGLIAVAAPARSRGIGSRLLGTALHWFHAQRAHVVRVSTYAHERSALRLYERQGFVTRSVRIWFHLWRSGT